MYTGVVAWCGTKLINVFLSSFSRHLTDFPSTWFRCAPTVFSSYRLRGTFINKWDHNNILYFSCAMGSFYLHLCSVSPRLNCNFYINNLKVYAWDCVLNPSLTLGLDVCGNICCHETKNSLQSDRVWEKREITKFHLRHSTSPTFLTRNLHPSCFT